MADLLRVLKRLADINGNQQARILMLEDELDEERQRAAEQIATLQRELDTLRGPAA